MWLRCSRSTYSCCLENDVYFPNVALLTTIVLSSKKRDFNCSSLRRLLIVRRCQVWMQSAQAGSFATSSYYLWRLMAFHCVEPCHSLYRLAAGANSRVSIVFSWYCGWNIDSNHIGGFFPFPVPLFFVIVTTPPSLNDPGKFATKERRSVFWKRKLARFNLSLIKKEPYRPPFFSFND